MDKYMERVLDELYVKFNEVCDEVDRLRLENRKLKEMEYAKRGFAKLINDNLWKF